MRNPNRHGTVFRLSGRRRKPWAAQVTTGWTNDGKQIRQLIGTFETKSEALQALALNSLHPLPPKAGITFGEIYNEWSEMKYPHITRSTADNYRKAWHGYLVRHAKVPMKDIRAAHIQLAIDECQNKGLSRSSMAKIRALSVMLFKYAMENDIANKNYATFARLPKAAQAKKQRFSDLEIKKIEQSDVPWADSVLILIYTGLRISEFLGLTRFNVNFEKQIITGGIKTEAGRDRVIPIHPKILSHMKRRYDQGSNWLICNENGEKLSAKQYRKKYYYPALEQVGVPRLTPHSCRHTFASLMAEAGVDPLSIQKLIGHSDYSTTANIYTHLDLTALQKAIEKI